MKKINNKRIAIMELVGTILIVAAIATPLIIVNKKKDKNCCHIRYYY